MKSSKKIKKYLRPKEKFYFFQEIQKKTNTRIHMKDELATDTIRVASITGLPDDAKLAEILIYQVKYFSWI